MHQTIRDLQNLKMQLDKDLTLNKPGDRWRWIWRVASAANLKSSEALVLSILAYRWNSKSRVVYPSQEKIAKNTNLSIASVKRAIRELSDKQLIKVVKGRHKVVKGRHRSPRLNTYWINFSYPEIPDD